MKKHAFFLLPALLLAASAVFFAAAEEPRQSQVGPHWTIGTTWRVEATNLQKQGGIQKQVKPVVWVFTVIGETTVSGRGCYEVAIRCQEDESDRQPRISLWVDKTSGMLVRMTSQIFVKGQWRTATETYAVAEGKSTAVFGSIPSLPLDMPMFAGQTGSKDLDGMSYEVVTGPAGAKAIGEAGFTYDIRQAIKPVSEAGAKSLGDKDAVEVELRSGPKNRVRQIWTPDKPWPVYSTNGMSESRLLDVTIPQENQE